LARRSIDILFPAGGENRRLAYQRQPPFTTRKASNVRAVDPGESRVRGGSRMGTLKAFNEQFGVGNPVTLLSQLRDLDNDGDSLFTEDFLTNTTLRWSAAPWKETGVNAGACNRIQPGLYGTIVSVDSATDRGSVLEEVGDIDPAEDYTITATIPDVTNFVQQIGTLEVYARMDNTTANVLQDGILVSLSGVGSGRYRIGLQFYAGGVLGTSISTLFDEATGEGGDLEIEIQAANTILVRWKGVERYNETYVTTAGTRIGLGAASGIGSVAQDGLFVAFGGVRISYVPLGGEQLNRNRVVAAALNTADDVDLYRETNVKTMIAVTSSSLAQTVRKTIVTAERLGKLYVPNPANAAPFVYDPSSDSIIPLVASAGTAPTKTRVCATFLDRLVFAGDADAPNIWYMSGQGNPLDWDYSGTTVQSAVAATSSGLFAGAMSGPIIALVPMAIDYLLLAERNRLGLLRGDPRQGGQIDQISYAIGIIGPTAWTHLPGGAIAFLGQNGLYALNPGPGNYPVPLSEDVIPEELKNLDPDANAIMLAYDPVYRGIVISVTSWDSIVGHHYWYNMTIGAFFPFILPVEQEPLSMVNYQSDSAVDAAVLFGCRDGYIRRFHAGSVNDDGTTIDSEVWLGPIALGGDGYKEGQILDIDLTMARLSGDANCDVYAAQTPEEAIALTTPSFTETVSAGRNVLHPQVRGASAFVVIGDDDSGSRWQTEALRMRYETLGDWRPD